MTRGFETDDTLTLMRRLGDRLPEPWDDRYRVDQRYEIRGRLGSGGFGSVFRAFDHVRNAEVAIKRLDHQGEKYADTIRREIAALRTLSLPNVVRCLDEFTWEKSTVLVMELVEGVPFPGKNRARTWEAIRTPTLSLLETVGRLHDAGVVHRDIKPANVLVTDDARAVLVDFGISHVQDVVARFRRSGTASGTPAYMAPEQFFGSVGDVRSDLYAIGAMVFECLTGRVPHESGSREQIVRRRIEEPAESLAALRPDLPPEVLEAVRRLLVREPAGRPSSAGEVLALLNRESYRDRVEVLVGQAPVDRHTAEHWFVGPERLVARPSRAAIELLRRTKGRPDETVRELRAWIRAGVARWQGDLLRVRDADLVRLESGLSLVPRSESRDSHNAADDAVSLLVLTRLSGGSLTVSQIREKCLWTLDRIDAALGTLLSRGHVELTPSGAWRLTEDAPQSVVIDGGMTHAESHPLNTMLDLLRVHPFEDALCRIETQLERTAREVPLDLFEALEEALLAFCPADDTVSLERVIELSVVQRGILDPRRAELLLNRIDRLPHRTPRLEYIRKLLFIAGGLARNSSVDSEEKLRSLGSSPNAEVERLRLLALGFLRDRQSSAELDAFIQEIAHLSRADDCRRETLYFLRARLAYRQSRFADAEADWNTLLALASESREVSARSNLLGTLLDAGKLDRLQEVVEQHAQSPSVKHNALEMARVEWIRRSIAYRRGQVLQPDGEFVDALFDLELSNRISVALIVEAAVAWRAGNHTFIRQLRERWREADTLVRPLDRALLPLFLLQTNPDEDVVDALHYVRSHARESAPGLVAQVLYLLALGGHPDAAEFARDAVELINRIPTPDRTLRREIVSPVEIEELAARLGVLDPAYREV